MSRPASRPVPLALLAILLAGLLGGASGRALAWEEMSAAAALTRISEGGDLILLDVREYVEVCRSGLHLENAVVLPWSSGVLPVRFDEVPTDVDIIVYCASGSRSPSACAFLEPQGYGRLFNLTTGMNGWPYPKEFCEPTPLLHVFKDGADASLDWIPAPGAQDYDLLRGSLDELSTDGLTVDLGTTDCLQRVLPYTYMTDPDLPGEGRGFFYLVRQFDSDYGTSSDELPRAAPPPGCD